MSKSAKLESALRVAGAVALFVGLALMIVGCKVGPNYRRPVVNMPQAYRAAMAPEVSNNSSSGASSATRAGKVAMTYGPVENGAERFLPARSRADDLRFSRRLASFRSFNVMEIQPQ